MRRLLLGACLTGILFISRAQMLPLRDQAKLIDQLLSERLNRVLPALMEKHGIDCWLIIGREYDEDPVLRTMLPASWMNARRRTMFIFFYDSGSRHIEKLAITRYNVGASMEGCWDVNKFPDQWDALVDLITKRAPRHIAVNISLNFAHADGLGHTEYTELLRRLPADYQNRIISAEPLAVSWLETRTEHEMQIYPRLINYTHRIISEAFSEKVISPGVTTTEDVEWWLRQRIRDDGYETWFHPSVSVQRDSMAGRGGGNSGNHAAGERIVPGDLVHVDFGITYLRLNTDVQELAYILRPGETSASAGLRRAFERANRLQDILTGEFAEGKTGNQILAAALVRARSEGIAATIYTHPIGFHGHGAGPSIGLWDRQDSVPGGGDFPMHYKTAYSIELNAAEEVPEWKTRVRMMLEEEGYFDESGFRFIGGRQKEIILVPRRQSLTPR